LTVTGSLAALNSALGAGLVYTPSNAYSGTDKLALGYEDLNDTLTTSASVPITVEAIGSPTIAAPSSETTNQGVPYTFSAGVISLTDPGASGASDSLSLSAAEGITLTLGSTSGITITGGSNGGSSMTINGTLQSINTALSGLTYQPNLNYSGSDTLTLSVADSATDLTGNATVGFTIIPAPSVTAPSSVFVNENSSFTFVSGAISLADGVASGTSDSVTLSVGEGILTLGSTAGLTFSVGNSGASSMTFSGTLANLNAAVAGLIYTPTSGYTGGDTLGVSLYDSGDGVTANGSVSISVGNFPPPSVKVPVSATLNENASYTFAAGALAVTDVVASGTSDSITLIVSQGTVTLGSTSGVTVKAGANNSSSMTVTGTLSNLNAALNGLVYTPINGYSGHDALAIQVSDLTDSQIGTGSVAIAVDPFVTGPATASVLENGAYAFSVAAKNPLAITDGAASTNSESMTLTVQNGKLTLATTSGITVVSGANSSSSMTVKGTLTNLNAALNGLTYAPKTTFTGNDVLSVTIADSNDNLSGTTTVAITVAFKHILAPAVSVAVTPSISPDDDLSNDPSPDQWAGVTAAVNVLYE
jgi:hypothetical protein